MRMPFLSAWTLLPEPREHSEIEESVLGPALPDPQSLTHDSSSHHRTNLSRVLCSCLLKSLKNCDLYLINQKLAGWALSPPHFCGRGLLVNRRTSPPCKQTEGTSWVNGHCKVCPDIRRPRFFLPLGISQCFQRTGMMAGRIYSDNFHQELNQSYSPHHLQQGF